MLGFSLFIHEVLESQTQLSHTHVRYSTLDWDNLSQILTPTSTFMLDTMSPNDICVTLSYSHEPNKILC